MVVDKEQKIQEDIKRLNCQFGENIFSYVDSKIVTYVDGEEIVVSQADELGELDEQSLLEIMENVIKSTHQEIYDEINKVSDYASLVLSVVNTDEQFEQIIEILTAVEKRHKRNIVSAYHSLVTAPEQIFNIIYGEPSSAQKELMRNCSEKIISNLSAPISAARALAEGKFSELRALKEGLEVNKPKIVNTIVINEPVSPSCSKLIEDNASNAKPISSYIQKFLDWKEDGRTRTKKVQQCYERELNFLICVIGDVPVNKVTQDNIQYTLKNKALMPLMSKKPYVNWGLEETVNQIISGYEVEIEDLIASKTVKETLKCYQSFFSSFLRSKEKDIATTPTDGVKVIWESTPYANYSDTQMIKIVEHCKSQSMTDKNMVILVGAYTGMRLSEICNITKESVSIDEDSGFKYLVVKKGKTKAATRTIPISEKLESIGFLGYLDKLKSKEKLFNKKTDLINEELRKIRDILNIPHENEFEQRRVFHSLRHSVITKARSKQISDPVLQKVVGHETRKSITDRYTHHFPVKDLMCVVECLDW